MTGRIVKVACVSLGVGTVAFMLLGARNFFPDDKNVVSPPSPKTTAPAGLGPVVPGVVDSEIEVGYYSAPDVLPIAKVKRVLVEERQSVTVGQPLIEFDDSQVQAKKKSAEAAVKIANVKVEQAKLLGEMLPNKKTAQQLLVNKAINDRRAAERALQLANETLENNFKLNNPQTQRPWTVEEKDVYRKQSIAFITAEAAVDSARLQHEREIWEKQNLDKLNPQLAIDEANAEVERYQAAVHEAQLLIDACTLKASVAGVVARVTVAPGAIVGPSSQKPTVIVVPSGKRLVRAEVVPEFAHKLAGSVGRAVVIFDNDNFQLKYDGEVIGVGEAFLPPRFASQDIMKLNANRVLECTILVKDPAPAGKPPLRVGQPVRVSFP